MDTLTAIPFFRGVPPEVARRHAASAVWVFAAAGQSLLDFEDESRDVFFVLAGSVRVVVRTPGGRELILDDLGPGRYFGEMSAIDGAPRSASVTALHTTRICRVTADGLLALLADAPELSLALLRELVARVRSGNARLFELAALDTRHRVHAELLRLAGPPGPGGERVISPPPMQQVIANRIGAAREAVSREVARLLREGLLARRRGALVLCDPAALERALAVRMEA